MSERDQFGFDVLSAHVARQLRREFPGWRIDWDRSGRWSATRDGWVVLYARTSEELRGRLRAYAARRQARHRKGDPP
jgi:hypothetical protein